jgi:hypothetical protein
MKVNYEEWRFIGAKLTDYLRICSCQRKLKSIVDVLVRIYEKRNDDEPAWTDEEYLILALLDSIGLVTHGSNIEYPIILDMTRRGDDFWEWIMKVKDDPNLENN